MKRRSHLLYKYFKHSWWHWLPGIIMFISLFLLYTSVHNILNPDLIAYCSVAQHYKDGEWITAFNSYWSPLICWIMAILPGLKKEPMLLFRLINITVAIVLYQQCYFWIRRVLYNQFNRLLCSILVAMLSLHYALYLGTPDFLSCLSFFIFLRLLLKFRFSNTQSLLLGLSILICYFSKTFLLPLCLSIVALLFLYQRFFLKSKIKFTPLFLIGFTLLTGLFSWASLLKLHYGFYTLGSSGSFNFILPTTEPLSLMAPPFKEALFPWEDPYYINIVFGHQGEYPFTLKQLLIRWKYNWNITLYLFRFFSFLWLGILIIPFIGFFQKKNIQWKICTLLFAVFFMNWFGYFLVFIHERYIIIGQYALYLCALGNIEIIFSNYSPKSFFSKISKPVSFFIFLSMAKNPIQEYKYGTSVNQWMKQQVTQAKLLADTGIMKGKNVAGFSNGSDLYDYISLACFQGDGRYYWEVWDKKSIELQKKEIQQYDLDYLILYDCEYFAGECDHKDWLNSYPVVYKDPVMKIKIVKIR